MEQTPDGFVFTVKASRYLTHIRRLRDIRRGVRRFYAPLSPLAKAGKLGPTLWQLPETFRRDDRLLAAALRGLPQGRHCLEFRHSSWFEPQVLDMLREAGVALVIGEDPFAFVDLIRRLEAGALYFFASFSDFRPAAGIRPVVAILPAP